MAGIANVVDVAGADELLHVGQTMAHGVLLAHQIGNQRMHARGGEQHGGVVLRNDRCAGDHGVSLGFKELEKQGSQIVVGLDVGIHCKSTSVSPKIDASFALKDEKMHFAVPP